MRVRASGSGVCRRSGQAGLTLLEVMIACAILAVMMSLAWKTMSGTGRAKQTYERYEARNHELRMAMRRVVTDFESAYLSKNEDPSFASTTPRTMFIARAGSTVPDIRFSTLGHRSLWADANESDETVISYTTRKSPDAAGGTDWVRREQRRLSNENPDIEAADYDILVTDIVKVELKFWSWKNQEWQDTWDTLQADGQKGMLPSRVKISITIKDPTGKEVTETSQARIFMSEPLNFVQ